MNSNRIGRMPARPSRARWAARISIPVALGGTAVIAAAGAALAASSVDVTSGGSNVAGSTLSSYATVTVTGHSTKCGPPLCNAPTISLYVTLPSGDQVKFASGAADKNGAFSGTYDLGSGTPINGPYDFSSSDGSMSDPKTVKLEVPPATPSGFHASVSGTVVTFGWSQNPEPDIDSYDVFDAAGNDITGSIDATPGGACDASACAVSKSFGTAAYGTSDSFYVVAYRHTAPHSSSTISSSPSTKQAVSFPAAPQPSSSPSSDPSAGGTGGDPSGGSGDGTGGTGGNGNGSTGGSGGSSSGNHGSTDLSKSLPTFTAGDVPNLLPPSTVTEMKSLPGADGTYKPTLAYPNQRQPVVVKKPALASRVAGAVAGVFDHSALWRGLAGAAVLVLVAGHLWLWVRRVDTDALA